MLLFLTLFCFQLNRDYPLDVFLDQTAKNVVMTVNEGDTPTVTLSVYDTSGGSLQSLAGYSATLVFTNSSGGQTVSGSVNNPSTGKVRFTFDTTDTGTVGAFSLSAYITNGSITHTLIRGKITVLDQVSVTNSNTLGSLYVYDTTSLAVTDLTVSGNAVISGIAWPDDGTVGQVLTTDGAGTWTFEDAAGGGGSVTMSGAYDYITLSGSDIVRGQVDLTTDVTGDLPVAEGGTGGSDAATARTNLGLVIGTNVQAYAATLADVAGLTPTDSVFIVGDGANFVAESGSTARTSLGLGSAATSNTGDFEASGAVATHAALTSSVHGITAYMATVLDDIDAATARTTLGVDAAGTDNSTDVTLAGTPDYITIAGQVITRGLIDLTADVSGDLPITEGGTGASDVGTARTNLGLAIGTDVQAYDADLTTLGGLDSSDSNFIIGSATGWVVESGATARASLGVDAAGTDNSTNVTLAGTPDYITIAGQVITRGLIDLTIDVSGDLPVTEGGTGASDASTARTNLGLAIGSDVQAYDSDLATIAGLTPTNGYVITGNGSAWTSAAASGGATVVWGGSASEVASSTTETTIMTVSIPGGTLGTASGLGFRVGGSMLNITGGSVNYTITIKYGATTVWSDVTALPNNPNYGGFYVEGILVGNGSTSAQSLVGSMSMARGAAADTGQGGSTTSNNIANFTGSATEDSTGALNLVVTVTMATNDANARFQRFGYRVEY